MSIEVIHHYITKIRDAKGSNAKKAILKEAFSMSEDFETFLSYVYNPQMSFYQANLDLGAYAKMLVREQTDSLDELYGILGRMDRKELLGKAGASALAHFAHKVDDQGKELIQIMLNRDLKAGVGAKTINAAYGETLIEILSYQRYDNMTIDLLKKMDFENGVYSQLKSDGMFCNGILQVKSANRPATMRFRSRSGSYLDCTQTRALAAQFLDNIVTDDPSIYGSQVAHGEFLVKDNETGLILPRAIGNGILNSVIQTGEPLEDKYSLIYRVWDIVPLADWYAGKCSIEYDDRWMELVEIVDTIRENEAAPSVELTETKMVYSFKEAVDHLKTMLVRKEEGTLLKPKNMSWEDGTTSEGVKAKLEMECELKIVGYNEADQKGKHADVFGSLQCESSDGLLAVGVSGMSDKVRQYIHDNKDLCLGGIVTVRSNGVQDNSSGDPLSLFLPRLVSEVRLDKNTANTLPEIYSIQASVIDDIQAKLLAE